ncbi:MAG: hypothetical protein KY469_15650 [Actinobacteria bacterium]|nr:hypothetical protein [Actinomycetota bacterium]
MSSEDARSDFVLAAAVFLLGGLVSEFVARLPGYPDGTLALALAIGWVFALSGLVPLLLARYRAHGIGAFGLSGDRSGVSFGVLIALPVAVVGILTRWTNGTSLTDAALGDLIVVLDPADLPTLVLGIGFIVASFLGMLLLYPFLTVRARDGFARNVLPLVEALRTFGMGAAAASLVFGLLNAIRPGYRPGGVLWTVGGLAVAVLLTDRAVVGGMETTRATIVAPMIIAAAAQFLAFGGIFGNRDLLQSLYQASLAAGTAVIIATLIETRARAWAVVPVALALAIYARESLSPL